MMVDKTVFSYLPNNIFNIERREILWKLGGRGGFTVMAGM